MHFTTKNLELCSRLPNQLRRTFTDASMPGLQFEVLRKAKQFRFRYLWHGRQRSIVIGPFPSISLNDARSKCVEFKRLLAEGCDPRDAQRRMRNVPTVGDFFYQQFMPYVQRYKSSWEQDRATYTNHIAPCFAEVPLNQITAISVHELTQRLLEQGLAPATVNRIVILFGSLFTLAHKQGVTNITKRQDLHIKLLPDPVKLERYISPDETQRLFVELGRSRNPLLKYIIAVLLLTGARRSEALHARWCDFDFGVQCWTIPQTKGGGHRRVSIRLDQAVFGVHVRSAFTSAFAISMSLRMMATMATFAGFPAAQRASYLVLRSGLCLIATKAGI